MSRKPVARRRQARQDVEQSVGHYEAEAGEDVAHRFITELEDALDHISNHPSSGSLRYAHTVGVQDLRAWPLKRFSHVILYVEYDSHVDVLRILHSKRDIPSLFDEPEG